MGNSSSFSSSSVSISSSSSSSISSSRTRGRMVSVECRFLICRNISIMEQRLCIFCSIIRLNDRKYVVCLLFRV